MSFLITPEEREKIEVIMQMVKEMDDIYVNLELIRRINDIMDGRE